MDPVALHQVMQLYFQGRPGPGGASQSLPPPNAPSPLVQARSSLPPASSGQGTSIHPSVPFLPPSTSSSTQSTLISQSYAPPSTQGHSLGMQPLPSPAPSVQTSQVLAPPISQPYTSYRSLGGSFAHIPQAGIAGPSTLPPPSFFGSGDSRSLVNQQRLSSAAATLPRGPQLPRRTAQRRRGPAIQAPVLPSRRQVSPLDTCRTEVLQPDGTMVQSLRVQVKVFPPPHQTSVSICTSHRWIVSLICCLCRGITSYHFMSSFAGLSQHIYSRWTFFIATQCPLHSQLSSC